MRKSSGRREFEFQHIQFPGRAQLAEDDGVSVQISCIRNERIERGIERAALRSQFLQVVDLPESDVVVSEKRFGGLLRRLPAVEYRGRRLCRRKNPGCVQIPGGTRLPVPELRRTADACNPGPYGWSMGDRR